MKCVICGKEIERYTIPRLKPIINEIRISEDNNLVCRPVCDACGNLLAIIDDSMVNENGYFKNFHRYFAIYEDEDLS